MGRHEFVGVDVVKSGEGDNNVVGIWFLLSVLIVVEAYGIGQPAARFLAGAQVRLCREGADLGFELIVRITEVLYHEEEAARPEGGADFRQGTLTIWDFAEDGGEEDAVEICRRQGTCPGGGVEGTHVRQAGGADAAEHAIEHGLLQVERDDLAGGADGLSEGKREPTGATAYIGNAHAGLEIEQRGDVFLSVGAAGGIHLEHPGERRGAWGGGDAGEVAPVEPDDGADGYEYAEA